jgi:uncharacterized protein (TIGR02246 family)
MLRRMQSLLFPVLVSLLVGCEAAEPASDEAAAVESSATDDAAVRTAIEARLDDYEKASMAGDLAALKGMWTPDVHVIGSGIDFSGAQFFAVLDQMFANRPEVQKFDVRAAEVFAHGDAAYAIGDYESTEKYGDAAPVSMHESYFARWQREADGTWRIDRWVTTPVAAAEGHTP